MPLGIGIPIGIAKASGGVPANLLLTNLQNYYALDEESGNAVDSIGGSNLTVAGAPASVVGLIRTARNFDVNQSGGSNQFFNFSSSSPVFKFVESTFAIGLWFKVDSGYIAGQAQCGLFRKANIAAGTNWSWAVYCSVTGTFVRFGVTTGGTSATLTTASVTWTPSADAWVYVVAKREVGSQIGVSINGGSYTTAAFVGSLFDGASAVNLGPSDHANAAGNMVMDEVAVWNGYTPTENQIIWLYNSGAGRALSEYSSAPLT